MRDQENISRYQQLLDEQQTAQVYQFPVDRYGFGRPPANERDHQHIGKQFDELMALYKAQRRKPRDLREEAASDGIDLDLRYERSDLGRLAKMTIGDYATLKQVPFGRTAKLKGRKRRVPYAGFTRTMIPADMTEEEARRFRAAFNRAQKAKRARDARAAIRAEHASASDLDCRASVLFSFLTDEPQTVSDLMKPIRKHKAFLLRDGSSMTDASLSKTMRNLINGPMLADKIKTEMRQNNFHRDVLWVWLKPA